MTTIHSSDLGWTAGQDISDEFATLAKTFKPGDTFVFDHMYEISGSNIQLPDNFTLAGGAKGAGFDVIDSATNSSSLMLLGHNNTLVDLTVTHSRAPDTGTTAIDITRNVDFHDKITFFANNKDDVKVLNSYFEGNVSIILRVSAGENLLIQDTEFNGGAQQVRLGADVKNPVIDNSLFQNALADGIKTIAGNNSKGVENATVSNSVFLNNSRDGIDTTGGFKNSLIKDSYFVGNGVSGLDIKEIYDSQDDFASGGPLSQNILITGTEFIDNRQAAGVTTLDRGDPPYLTQNNAKKWVAQDIRIENSIIENTASSSDIRVFHVKDSYDVHWKDVTLLGNVTEVKIRDAYDIGMPQDVSGTGVKTGAPRAERPDSYYQSLAGPDWFNISYPTDGTPTPIDLVVEPDPISYTPPNEPDQTNDSAPVVAAPVSSNNAPVAKSDVANTDHDKTILVDVLGNDSDPDGDALKLTKASYSGNTSIISIENGKIKVNPLSAAKEDRVETIVYTLSDGKGGTDTAELKVNVGQAAAPAPKPEPVVKAPVDPEPVVEPDPISYSPPQQPDPVVEAAAPQPEPVLEAPVADSSAPAAGVSNLLDVFVAYTDTDETLAEIGAGSSIDSSLTDGRSLTIYATANGSGAKIGSVKLTVDGVGSRVESVEPYALFGDSRGDFLGGMPLSEGIYSAELVVYSDAKGKGNVLETVSFDFAVDSATSEASEDSAASQPIVTPTDPETYLEPDVVSKGSYSEYVDIKLFDTGTDKALFDLRDGTKLANSDLAGRTITLAAEAINAEVEIGSVRLEMDGHSQMENVEPYALFGDRRGDFKDGIQIPDGTHSLTLTAYSGKNGKGSVLEQVTLSFEVGDYDSLLIDGTASTVSSYSSIQDTGTATVSRDQSTIDLEGSAWKSLSLFGEITEETVLRFDFKSDAEGEIQGIGFVNENGTLESIFFQLDGAQDLGIQDFNGAYETGSGFKSYTIPVGEYYTGAVEQLVLVSDDDADFGAMSAFSNIGLIEGIS